MNRPLQEGFRMKQTAINEAHAPENFLPNGKMGPHFLLEVLQVWRELEEALHDIRFT